MKTIIKIKTWRCSCGYSQDFEPTQENHDKHFNRDIQYKVSNLQANQCPSCALKKQVGTLVLETNPNKKTVITIMGEDELDTLEVEDNDTKEKRLLKKSEKDELKTKIRSDIEKFSQMQ